MGDAGQQLLPAGLLPLGLLHRGPRPLGHVVEVLAHRLELVPAVVGDAVGEVAVPDLVNPLRQGLQGLLDMPEHEPGEEAVGDQHRRQDHHHRRGQEGGRQVLRLVGQVGDHPLAVDLQLIGDPPAEYTAPKRSVVPSETVPLPSKAARAWVRPGWSVAAPWPKRPASPPS